MNDLFNEISVNEIPCIDCISPKLFCKEFAAFLTLAVSQTTPLAEGVENGFQWLGKVIVVVILGVIILVVTCKGKDNLGAQGWVGPDVVGAEFTVVAKGREVAGKGVNEGLLSQNCGGVVDEEK